MANTINYIDYNDVTQLIDRYVSSGGDCYVIDGCLLDNYILFSEKLKTIIIKEQYLNEWSSINTIRTYNNTPKKYEKVIELLNDDRQEEARKLFFS